MKTIEMRMAAALLPLLCSTLCLAQPQWVTDTVLSTGFASSGIALTPDNSKLVVTVKANPGLVKVINTSNFSVNTINVSAFGNFPDGVAVTPNGSFALVCTSNKVLYVDIVNYSVTASFAAPCVGTTLYDIAISSGGILAFFPDMSSGCTQQGMRSIAGSPPGAGSNFTLVNTSGQLFAIELSSDGNYALITGFSSGGVPKVINLSTAAVQNIGGISSSYGAAALHSTNEALIFDGDSVVRVSLNSNSIIKKVTSLGYNTSMQSIHISGNDKYAFAIGDFQKKAIDLSNNTVIQNFSSGGTNVVANSDGSRFYVTEYGNGNVRAYQQQTTVAVPDPVNGNRISVYPNPFTAKVSFSVNDPELLGLTLQLFDINGKVVKEIVVSARTEVDLQTFTDGMYFYFVGGEKGKVVKQ